MNNFTIISLDGVSEIRKKLIYEAMSLKDKKDAAEKGWKKIGSGAFKTAYRKRNIVIKFDRNSGSYCKREGLLYIKVKPDHKKHFARIYAFKHDRCIQEYIKNKKMSREAYRQLNKVVRLYGVVDYWIGHNVGIRSTRPVIFDYMRF